VYNGHMLAISLFRWWYGSGWAWAAGRLGQRLRNVIRDYSVSILIKTLFKPWKQIIAAGGAQTAMGMKFNMMVDNLISRLVGLMVRSLTLVAAMLIWMATALVGGLVLVAWPVVPALLVIIPLYAFGVIA